MFLLYSTLIMWLWRWCHCSIYSAACHTGDCPPACSFVQHSISFTKAKQCLSSSISQQRHKSLLPLFDWFCMTNSSYPPHRATALPPRRSVDSHTVEKGFNTVWTKQALFLSLDSACAAPHPQYFIIQTLWGCEGKLVSTRPQSQSLVPNLWTMIKMKGKEEKSSLL